MQPPRIDVGGGGGHAGVARMQSGVGHSGVGHSGVGLGLPTALAIAQAHGGRIEVDSEPGRGSRFVLVVPSQGPEQQGEG